MRAMIQSLCVPYIVGKAQRLTGQSLGLGDFTLFPSSRAKSRRDLEVYLGANGRVCKDRARQYGQYGSVRTRATQICITRPLEKFWSWSKNRANVTSRESLCNVWARARFIRTWFQLPLSSRLTPMPFPNQEEASCSFGCSTSSRRRCAHQWRPEAVLGRSPLSHGRPEERRPLEACTRHSYSLSKKKDESFQLVPGWARFGSYKSGPSHVDKILIRWHQMRIKKMPLECDWLVWSWDRLALANDEEVVIFPNRKTAIT
uniref:Uncharacterized protein n=1 Tax=Brassica oleracea var. oleracea TaxID=109376 RepID=A0A0D2ZUE6_BRAOL